MSDVTPTESNPKGFSPERIRRRGFIIFGTMLGLLAVFLVFASINEHENAPAKNYNGVGVVTEIDNGNRLCTLHVKFPSTEEYFFTWRDGDGPMSRGTCENFSVGATVEVIDGEVVGG